MKIENLRVVRNMLPNSLLKLNTLQLKIKFELTIVCTAVDFNSHTDGSLMRTVGVKSDLWGENHWIKISLDSYVGVSVTLHNFTVLNISISDPLVQSWSPIFQQIIFWELRTLSVSKSSHSLCCCYCMDIIKIDFYPFWSILSNHVSRAPGTSVLIQSDPETKYYFNLEFYVGFMPNIDVIFYLEFIMDLIMD